MGSRVLRVCSVCWGAAVLAAGLGVPRALAAPPPAVAVTVAPQAVPDRGWLASAARQIAEREYRASTNDAGLQAPNRRHNLRSYFEPTGVRVHDRTAPGAPRLLSLELVGLGRSKPLTAVLPGRVVSDGPRVEIRRPGLVEWYLNSPEGLEQGFTLARRPGGEGPLVLELALSGSQARLAGPELRIKTHTGRWLAYGALAAEDADGNTVVARLETSSQDRIALVVDDRGARYPLTIDPLLTATADTQLESDQASALFGGAVAGAGDVNGDGYADVIVGAEEYDAGLINEGAAFVFLGSAAGIVDVTPAPAGVAQLESNQSGALFGTSVAGAGDVNGDGYADVIVGAQLYDAGTTDEGAAFVFLGSAAGIADGNPSTAATQLESDQGTALFGGSVAGAGDVNGDGYADVIVGAEEYNAPSSNEGAAFVFLGSAAGIADGNPTTAPTQLESNQTGALLGGSVSGAGDVNGDGYADVIVGAEVYDSGTIDEGAAFVFVGSAAGIADGNPLTAATQLESDQGTALFGGAVAGAGDVNGDGYADVIVGAQEYNAPSSNEGAAFVFLGSAAGIADSTPATAGVAQLESDQASALLGGSVAGAGDVNGDGYADVIVGAIEYDAPTFNEGAAFVFLGSAAGIADGNPTTAAAQLESNQSGASMGSVAGAGDVNGDGYADVIVGADAYDHGQTDEGAAFVFLGGAAGIADGTPATAGVAQLESDQANALLGRSVAGAGDVNGDGYGDVIVGAPEYDAGQADEGAAFIFLGGAAGIADATPATAGVAQLESDQAGAHLGGSVSGAGDTNGDGYADVIVGADAYDNGQTDEGAAFVFLGGAAGIADATPATAGVAQLESDQAGALLGGSVSGAGDVNGDGFGDVIVGADAYDNGQTDEGAAFIFLGGAAGIADATPATAAARLESDQAGALLGTSVAGAGDTNGDGYADVIVGADAYDNGQVDEGAAFVFLGGIADGTPVTAAAQLESDQAGALLGGSVAGAGDVNGDGYADVIVGAIHYDAPTSNEGAAFVFLGGAAGIADATPATAGVAQLESDQADALLGGSVSGAGDVNGDGFGDVIVGADGYDNGQTDEGAAFVFLGSASGVADGTPTTAAAQLESNQAGARLGTSVAGAGDVNGDGSADVIVGADTYDNGQTDEGAAFVFLGNGDGDGRAVLAEQRRGDASTIPVQPRGSSHASGFEVAMTATHPGGRGRVKLEVEACPFAAPFGDPSCTTQVGASWTDVTATTAGVRLVELMTGLAVNTPHRWRARVLQAPFRVTQPGITSPPNPAHAPWRRVQAQVVQADILLPEPSERVLLLSALAFLLAVGRRRIAANG